MRDGKVVVRKIMPVALVFDHRIIDGADGAKFVNHIKELLEKPRAFLKRVKV